MPVLGQYIGKRAYININAIDNSISDKSINKISLTNQSVTLSGTNMYWNSSSDRLFLNNVKPNLMSMFSTGITIISRHYFNQSYTGHAILTNSLWNNNRSIRYVLNSGTVNDLRNRLTMNSTGASTPSETFNDNVEFNFSEWVTLILKKKDFNVSLRTNNETPTNFVATLTPFYPTTEFRIGSEDDTSFQRNAFMSYFTIFDDFISNGKLSILYKIRGRNKF